MSGSSDYTTTPNLALFKPISNRAIGTWGDLWNANADALDAAIAGSGASIINVLDHGAKGDGITDDTAAIQSVLNTYAGKATVFVPDTGHPYMVNPLVVPSGTDLLINGTLMLRGGNSNGVLVLQSVNNVTVRGHGTIDGNRAAQTATSAGINGGSCDNVSVSGITLRNAYAWNFNIGQSTRVRLDNLKMLNGGNANEFAAGCDDCWITNCTIDGNTTDFGFAFYGGITNSGAIGNTFRNSAVGVFVYADSGQPAVCKNIIIANNIAYNNYSSGIAVDTSAPGVHSHIVIANNRVYGNNTGNASTVSGIFVDHVASVIIADNMVSSNDAGTVTPAYGIGLGANAVDTTITGNSTVNIGSASLPGGGLHILSSTLVNASGNTMHDFRTPSYMTSAISGTAGSQNTFIGNVCDQPITIAVASDTVLDNVVGGHRTGTLPINAANDAAAAAAGVPLGGMYRNANALQVRLV
jgi:hypothetical protein